MRREPEPVELAGIVGGLHEPAEGIEGPRGVELPQRGLRYSIAKTLGGVSSRGARWVTLPPSSSRAISSSSSCSCQGGGLKTSRFGVGVGGGAGGWARGTTLPMVIDTVPSFGGPESDRTVPSAVFGVAGSKLMLPDSSSKTSPPAVVRVMESYGLVFGDPFFTGPAPTVLRRASGDRAGASRRRARR